MSGGTSSKNHFQTITYFNNQSPYSCSYYQTYKFWFISWKKKKTIVEWLKRVLSTLPVGARIRCHRIYLLCYFPEPHGDGKNQQGRRVGRLKQKQVTCQIKRPHAWDISGTRTFTSIHVNISAHSFVLFFKKKQIFFIK